MAVDFPITGSSDDLTTALEAAIRAFTAATDESNKLKQAEKELAEQEKKAAEETKKLAEQIEKNKSKFEKAKDAVLKWGASMGGAATAAKTVVDGVTGTISAVNDFISSVREASKELEGFISRENVKQLEELNTSFDDIDKSVLLLKASIVTELAPSIEKLTNLMIGAIAKTSELDDEFTTFGSGGTIERFGEFVEGWVRLNPIIDKAAEYTTKWATATEKAGEAEADQLKLMNDINKGWADAPKFIQDLIKEEEKIAEVVKKSVEDRKKAEQDLEDWRNQAISDRIIADAADWQKRQDAAAAYYEWLRDARAEDFEAAAEEAAEAIAAMAEQQEEATDAWIEQQEARKEASKAAVEEIATAWLDFFQAFADMNLEAKQAALDAIHEEQDATRDAADNAIGQRKRVLDWHLEVLKVEEEEAKKAAKKAFAISQAAAVSQVIASGAAAFAQMLVGFAALGPAAPILAGAIVGPSIATQLAVISKNKPPAHSGAALGADELPFGNRTVRNGEGAVIFNQRAVEQGAMERAMADNRAAMGGGTSSEVRLVLADSGRAISEVATRDARRPGSAFGTPVRGFSDPYRRR